MGLVADYLVTPGKTTPSPRASLSQHQVRSCSSGTWHLSQPGSRYSGVPTLSTSAVLISEHSGMVQASDVRGLLAPSARSRCDTGLPRFAGLRVKEGGSSLPRRAPVHVPYPPRRRWQVGRLP